MQRVVAILTLVVFFIALPSAPAAADGGLKVFLASAIELNEAAATITLPLFEGVTPGGATTWYIVTESSQRDDARARGVNWSPKLANALGTAAVQSVTVSGGLVRFAGTVDFRPVRVVTPGPTGFPPAVATPGSVGDRAYSPLITTGDGVVLNAPQVANPTGLHDRVVSIDFAARRVTLHLTQGFYHGKRILYISTDSSFSVAAALEAATFAPNLDAAPGLGSNDPRTSARASIVPIVNGATGATDPERQGLQSALLDGLDPLNITIAHPNNSGEIPNYSPLWDVHAAVWTEAAIASGQRVLLDHHEKVADAVRDGLLVSAFSGPANPDLGGLRAAGFIVNCPIMAMRS